MVFLQGHSTDSFAAREGRIISQSYKLRIWISIAGNGKTSVNPGLWHGRRQSWHAGDPHTGADERHLPPWLGWVSKRHRGRHCEDCGDTLCHAALKDGRVPVRGRLGGCCNGHTVGNPKASQRHPKRRVFRWDARFRFWMGLPKGLPADVANHQPTSWFLGDVAVTVCRVAVSMHLELLLLKCVGRYSGNDPWNSSFWCCCPSSYAVVTVRICCLSCFWNNSAIFVGSK